MNVSKRPGSKNYHLRASVNGRRIQVSLGTADKRIATAKAAKIVEREERRQAGLWSEVDDGATKPVAEHIEDFLATLKAKGVSTKHHEQRRRSLEAMVEAVRARRVTGIDGPRVARWLTDLEDAGRSITTRNLHLSACKQFTRWLVADRRAAHDTLVLLKSGKRETDRRLVRRALTVAEVDSLLRATAARPLKARENQGLSERFKDHLRARGRRRALVYEFALRTGVRRSEMAGLVWADLDLSDEPTFTVRAAESKSGKRVTLPLDERVAEKLRRTKPKGVFPKGRVFQSIPGTRTFYADLKAAKIDKGPVDDRVDFHALRHTFVTRLSEKGVLPQVAQQLARHSTMDLTMGHYTHLRISDLRAAISGHDRGARSRIEEHGRT